MRGLVDIPIVFVGLLILAVIVLIVLTLFGFNLIDRVQELVMGSLEGLADFFSNLLNIG